MLPALLRNSILPTGKGSLATRAWTLQRVAQRFFAEDREKDQQTGLPDTGFIERFADTLANSGFDRLAPRTHGDVTYDYQFNNPVDVDTLRRAIAIAATKARHNVPEEKPLPESHQQEVEDRMRGMDTKQLEDMFKDQPVPVIRSNLAALLRTDTNVM